MVREILVSLDLARWQDYATSVMEECDSAKSRSGIMVAVGQKRYLRGLFAYQICADLLYERRLIVDCFAVPVALDRHAVAETLFRASAELATEHRCQAVHVRLGPQNEWLSPLLAAAGYTSDVTQFVRPIARHGRV